MVPCIPLLALVHFGNPVTTNQQNLLCFTKVYELEKRHSLSSCKHLNFKMKELLTENTLIQLPANQQ